MPKYFEGKEESNRPCAALREDLKQCLLESPCVKIDKKTPRECLQPNTRIDQDCKELSQAFFECKRSLLDMRTRFRGRKTQY
ncbi:cytochrome c oxidase assembly factor 5-like [Amphiura filiformis]|uniref:cytochrome c oxidase assembly factor 5-like n=1 Tax=Amphiura filiformis TaxID=82378 RepID=UPI003B219E84